MPIASDLILDLCSWTLWTVLCTHWSLPILSIEVWHHPQGWLQYCFASIWPTTSVHAGLTFTLGLTTSRMALVCRKWSKLNHTVSLSCHGKVEFSLVPRPFVNGGWYLLCMHVYSYFCVYEGVCANSTLYYMWLHCDVYSLLHESSCSIQWLMYTMCGCILTTIHPFSLLEGPTLNGSQESIPPLSESTLPPKVMVAAFTPFWYRFSYLLTIMYIRGNIPKTTLLLSVNSTQFHG